jgi:Reverse transcriptase (RNA-dependent DNA polymerase)
MPRTDQVFNSLRNKRLLNVLDMANAYLSVPLSQDTNYIASFVTRRGQFEFLIMPAGLASAGSVFNPLIMQRVFNDMCWSDICCFVDDLVCPCSSVDEGMRLIEKIFRRIRFANLKLKANK